MESSTLLKPSVGSGTSTLHDSLHLPAIQAGGATCILLGLVGFVTTILSPAALTYLGLAACGVVLVVGCLALQIQEHGLLRFMSPELRKMLLEVTLLEWCKDPTVGQKIAAFVKECFPVFLCQTEAEEAEALSNMSPALRRNLTTKGLVSLLGPGAQSLLLPRELREERARVARNAAEAEVAAAAAAAAGPPTALPPPSLAGARLDSQGAFVARLLKLRRLEFLLKLLPAAQLKQASALAMGLLFAQLAASSRARRMVGAVGSAGALGCAVASVGTSLGLLGLRAASEQEALAEGGTVHAPAFRALLPAAPRTALEEWWAARSYGERQAAVASASALASLAVMRTVRSLLLPGRR